jgi:hypothetical protein
MAQRSISVPVDGVPTEPCNSEQESAERGAERSMEGVLAHSSDPMSGYADLSHSDSASNDVLTEITTTRPGAACCDQFMAQSNTRST